MVYTDDYIYTCPECGWLGLVQHTVWLAYGDENIESCPICWDNEAKSIPCDFELQKDSNDN